MSENPEARDGPHADGVRSQGASDSSPDASGKAPQERSSRPESLIERVGRGDEDAWTNLWHDLLPGIRATARVLVPEDDVQGVIQDVAMAVWQNVASFRGDSPLQRWAHRITVRKCLEVRRKTERRLDVLQAFAAQPSNETGSRSAAFISQGAELAGLLRQCFLTLHPTDRSALYLRTLRDLSYSQVAETLGCSEETARQRCQRARENLRSLLLREIDETDSPQFDFRIFGPVGPRSSINK